MSWHVAMDYRTLLTEFWRHEDGRHYGRNFYNALYRQYGDGTIGTGYDSLAPISEALIGGCEPIYVEEEVVDLIDHARQTFQPESILREDLMVPWGFAYLARPIITRDVNGKRTSVRAISWAPYQKRYLSPEARSNEVLMFTQAMDAAQGNRAAATVLTDAPDDAYGLVVELYSHVTDEDDFTEEFLAADNQDMVRRWNRWSLTLMHFTHLVFGTSYTEQMDETDLENEGAVRNAQEFHTLMQTLFRLMQQRIAVKHPEIPPRPSRKRAARANLPERKVLVVTLRRASNPQPKDDGSDFEYSHRFIVGGHWRNQWYPSLQAHRQIWIADFIKGPEDKELIIKERAFDFAR